jgi:hypothetical protein
MLYDSRIELTVNLKIKLSRLLLFTKETKLRTSTRLM